MRRGLLLFVNLNLLGALIGCHHSHSACDCQTQPLDHLTPSPVVKPAAPAGPMFSAPAASTDAPQLAH